MGKKREEIERMEIHIDNRERDLILKMQMNCLTFDVKTLDIGDIHIIDEKTKEIFGMIERKTLEDLSSSITDGRYKEQKQRLLHSVSSKIRKIYILEGDDLERFHLGKTIFDGVMVNTVVRDKIMIYRTKDLEETMEVILKIKRCFEKNYEEILAERMEKGNEELEYQVFKTIKKENLDEKVGFKTMLSVIPQVSNAIAEVIYAQYGNMENFIKKIREEGDITKIVLFVSEMKYGVQQKRIGISIAKKIILYLFDCTEEEREMISKPNFGIPVKKSRKKVVIETPIEMMENPLIPTPPTTPPPKIKRTIKVKAVSLFSED